MTTFVKDLLAGRVAFVAGGTSGINLAIAHALVEYGASVAVFSRSPERVAKAVEELSAGGAPVLGYPGDVREYAAVEASLTAARDALGPLDIVISGAAGNFVAPASQLSAN